ncbi:MAG: hypothetical protein EOO82_01845 [Oxalobacteraceae bacterium]|nr:MAG: hypothetical protein EOO82_01845 [Oxalobacteraceae bacterium]
MICRETISYPVSIFIAGRACDVEDMCMTYCDEVGLCVTATPTTFIYTGGEEAGYIVGLINYPRFPNDPATIWAHAETLAARLCAEAEQQSYTIQAPDKTVWFSHRPEDNA